MEVQRAHRKLGRTSSKMSIRFGGISLFLSDRKVIDGNRSTHSLVRVLEISIL